MLLKNMKDKRVYIVGVDPDTIQSLRSLIRINLLPFGKSGSTISVDLSANCDGWIYDPNRNGIQIPIKFRYPSSGSTHSMEFSTGCPTIDVTP